MKRLYLLTLFFAWCGLVLHAQNKKPFVIPELKEWKGGNGMFETAEGGRIVYNSRYPQLQETAAAFANDLRLMFGTVWTVSAGKACPGDIELVLKPGKPRYSAEEYELNIGKKVVITAPQTVGIYWGTRSLLQMMEQEEKHGLPCGEVKDWPDYSVRGLMLDCGRKFIPLEYLQDYVKIMSYYKMNTFQIHLNDNAFARFYNWNLMKTYSAFRLQCDTYPGLTAQDGSYSKQEFIDLQKLAESKFVNIIPEIDVPAHSLAFTQYKPEIGSKKYGMDHLDLFNPETYKFVDNLFKEYLEGENPVFRGKQVHIGTDEYSNKDQEVVEKFRYFTDHYIKYVEKFGKQACVWGALTHAKGQTPVKSENVIMNAWYNGYADPKEMVKQGYKLISMPDGWLYIVPAAGYYYDYLNTKRLYEEWTPAHVGKVVFEEKDPAILGGMFAVWNDHAGNGISTKDIHDRMYPAVQTLAVKMWTGAHPQVSFADFEKQRQVLNEAPGVNQGGKIGSGQGLVYTQAEVQPNSELPYQEVGYNYRVEFELDGQPEAYGTELFRSSTAVFYLSDPIKGMMGFTRDGYLNTIPYRVKNEKVKVCVEGDNKSTRFYINGKLVESMQIGKKYFNGGKDSMSNVRTLVFPLKKSGNFKSRISNLCVYQNRQRLVHVRMMTYNVHNCIGTDKVRDYDRIARIVMEAAPDVVALQELDSVTSRNHGRDALTLLKEKTGLYGVYASAIPFDGGSYGIGVLSKEKPLKWKKIPMPGREEARMMLVVEYKDFVWCATHQSLTPADQQAAVELIVQATGGYHKPVFLAGDMNSTPESEVQQSLSRHFTALNDVKKKSCIDYVYCRKQDMKKVSVLRQTVVNETVASDHQPIWVDVSWRR